MKNTVLDYFTPYQTITSNGIICYFEFVTKQNGRVAFLKVLIQNIEHLFELLFNFC